MLKSKAEAGFTLIEIAIAVALLGIALATLIGLQTRIVSNYLQESNRVRAALYAQYLMTRIEVDSKPPDPTDSSGDLRGELEKSGYLEDAFLEDETEALDGWTFSKSVTQTGVPPFEDVLRRVDLTISWGEGDRDQYNLVYFARTSDRLPRLNIPGAAGSN